VLYDIRARKPAPVVPRVRIIEVDERMAFDGTVVRPLREEDIREAVGRIRAAANGGTPGAVVLCFLHSYVNPSHERAAARLVAEGLPDWFVCTSQEVLPELREYERFSTAVLNAYIGPTVGGYLDGLSRALVGHGVCGPGVHHDLERRDHDLGGCRAVSRSHRALGPGGRRGGGRQPRWDDRTP